MRHAAHSEALHKCQAILGTRLFVRNVAAQVTLQRVKKEEGGGAELGRVEPAPRKDEDQGQNQSRPGSLSKAVTTY